jgi:hypothetical protein
VANEATISGFDNIRMVLLVAFWEISFSPTTGGLTKNGSAGGTHK